MIALVKAPQSQAVGPVLGGDGVAVADDCPVFRLRQHGNIAQEVEQMGLPGGFQINMGILRPVAVGVESLGQGTLGIDHAAHQGEAG